MYSHVNSSIVVVKVADVVGVGNFGISLCQAGLEADNSIGPTDFTLRNSWSMIAYIRPLPCLHNMQPLQRAALRSARGVRSQIQRRYASHGAGDAHHSSGNESFGVR
jgi:hypothetical protein